MDTIGKPKNPCLLDSRRGFVERSGNARIERMKIHIGFKSSTIRARRSGQGAHEPPFQRLALMAQDAKTTEARCVKSSERNSRTSRDPNSTSIPWFDRSTCVFHRTLCSPSSLSLPRSHSPSRNGRSHRYLTFPFRSVFLPRDLDPIFRPNLGTKRQGTSCGCSIIIEKDIQQHVGWFASTDFDGWMPWTCDWMTNAHGGGCCERPLPACMRARMHARDASVRTMEDPAPSDPLRTVCFPGGRTARLSQAQQGHVSRARVHGDDAPPWDPWRGDARVRMANIHVLLVRGIGRVHVSHERDVCVDEPMERIHHAKQTCTCDRWLASQHPRVVNATSSRFSSSRLHLSRFKSFLRTCTCLGFVWS